MLLTHPLMTFPNTTCFPSSQRALVSSTKNCEPENIHVTMVNLSIQAKNVMRPYGSHHMKAAV